ncbi:MAG TPA: dihydrofolate reductase family protein [Jatrophihabitans sp.]|jgi:dihydrofolate reductase|uniref:dihydrofolate reductase family protein n=1 Tax=Jatrophihabitans sp. TaxID=1932789 RepID=UPI002EEFFB77
MAKLLYSASMSLDGFIAGPGGDMSWLTGHLGPNPIADELIGQIGALLIGNRTYRGDDPNRGTDKEGAFGGRWSGPQFVLSHHARHTSAPGVVFLDDLHAAVAEAKAAAGERYVNILGASVARQCLQAGLLDEILVFIVPTLLGDGVRLLDQPGGVDVLLEHLSVHPLPHATGLWFGVRR